MKLSKKTASALGCLITGIMFALIALQIVFLTMKLVGAYNWSWWTTLIPFFCMIGLPIAIIVVAVIVLAPKVLIENRQRRKRVEAEAAYFGLERKPGESIGDLKKRIVRRNMISGNYSRKDIKDILLENFPALASVQFEINNQSKNIVMLVRKMPSNYNGWKVEQFTDDELKEIAAFADQYVPFDYEVTIRNAETKEGESNDEASTDSKP